MPKILVLLSFLFLPISVIQAAAYSATGSATVTATVPVFTSPSPSPEPDTPVLISPGNNSLISSSTPIFFFNPSLGTVTVGHYQLYLDGIKHVDHIPPSTITIAVNAQTSLKEGLHSWYIAAIGANGVNRNSATWIFTVDTTAPLIVINQIDDQPVNLTQPGFSFSTSNRYPVITGQSEPNSQLSINFSGPISQTITVSVKADGSFSLQPRQALITGSYTLWASATDQAGNTSTLAPFNLILVAPEPITISLPSPLPTIEIPLPILDLGPIGQLPQAFTAYSEEIICQRSPLIWIFILILLLYILYLRYQVVLLKQQVSKKSPLPQQIANQAAKASPASPDQTKLNQNTGQNSP